MLVRSTFSTRYDVQGVPRTIRGSLVESDEIELAVGGGRQETRTIRGHLPMLVVPGGVGCVGDPVPPSKKLLPSGGADRRCQRHFV